MPGSTLPTRAGRAWDYEEDTRLLTLWDSGLSVQQIAERHQRTTGAITARLVRHGRIENPLDGVVRPVRQPAAGARPPATSAADPAATRTVMIHLLPEEARHLLRALQFEEDRLDDVLQVGDVDSDVLRKVQEAKAAVEQLQTRLGGLLPR